MNEWVVKHDVDSLPAGYQERWMELSLEGVLMEYHPDRVLQ